ncbi:MAG: molybdenum cofactor biosynthesis protein MoaE [Candidatus Omnitrophica bacterium]|nr:molybdenum cofactor biosynthesis protein MoaE [Candidatus Omnitrophota bacterium]
MNLKGFITSDPIPLGQFFKEKLDPSCGALTSFVGVVRNHREGHEVKKLYYDCYRSMVDQEIGRIIDEVKKEFGINDIKVLHRVGWIKVGEVAVVISVSARHRGEAFSACRAVIDRIKERAPIWKKEVYADGTSEWTSCACFSEVTS